MAKTSAGRSIDTDIKPARFIGYCRILAAQNAEHFFLLLVRFNTEKFFFPCWLEFLNSTFFIFFTILLLGCSFMLESGFLLLPIFHRSSRFADILYMYTDSGNVACDLILFRAFLGGFLQRLLYSRMARSISRCLDYAISLAAKALSK